MCLAGAPQAKSANFRRKMAKFGPPFKLGFLCLSVSCFLHSWWLVNENTHSPALISHPKRRQTTISRPSFFSLSNVQQLKRRPLKQGHNQLTLAEKEDQKRTNNWRQMIIKIKGGNLSSKSVFRNGRGKAASDCPKRRPESQLEWKSRA